MCRPALPARVILSGLRGREVARGAPPLGRARALDVRGLPERPGSVFLKPEQADIYAGAQRFSTSKPRSLAHLHSNTPALATVRAVRG